MLTGILMVGLSLWLILANPVPVFKTPVELALWAKCDAPMIGYGAAQSLDYKWHVPGDAETCLKRRSGNCVCHAVVAKAALDYCPGYTTRLARLTKAASEPHLIVLYTDHLGRRGFVNGQYSGQYKIGTPWPEVVEGVGGGHWELEGN